MSEWQPIETAEKSSRFRLVWCPERRNTHLACWWFDGDREGWSEMSGGWLEQEPTHWMPIPPPPVQTDG